jgi:homoserine dehydrogenase
MGTLPTRYHVSLDVVDRAGVLSAITGEFAHHGVSIAAARQTGEGNGEESARIVVVTHRAPEAALAATVDALAGLDVVHGVHSVLRVEDLGRKGVAR